MGGAGAIYFTSIKAWAEVFCLPATEFDVFFYLIRQMDAEFLLWLAEQAEKNAPPKPPIEE